jgi:hypothetical protein
MSIKYIFNQLKIGFHLVLKKNTTLFGLLLILVATLELARRTSQGGRS